MSFKSEKEINTSVERIRKSNLFDQKWYLDTYTDVKLLGMDPIEHFVKFGSSMLRDPNPSFSTRFYRNTHDIVRKNNLNPFLHYLTRKPKPHLAPNPKQVLWAAGLQSDIGDDERAIQLAEEYLPKKASHVINLLRANQVARRGNCNAWQRKVNEFLDHYDVAPIELTEGEGTIFERLSSSKLPRIKSGPVVSIIMPAWNAEKTISYAINSIMNQTWEPLELLVVDDASTDGTWQVIRELAQKDARIKPLRNTQNVGPYVSKNIALKYAKGVWVTGHDSDDWAHPQRIESHAKYLISNNKIASLMGMVRLSDKGLFTRLSPIGKNTVDGACVAGFISMMCDRTYLDQRIGHWDEMRFGGDSELIHRLEETIGAQIPRFRSIGMFCLDNPDGLTNHPLYGHKPGGKVAKERHDYKSSFQKWHQSLTDGQHYLDFPQQERRFPAPKNALNAPGKASDVYLAHTKKAPVSKAREISTDVCIVTNLRFPGGNTSSTIDEVKFLERNGLKVTLLHCPVDRDFGKPISERYFEHGDLISTFGNFAQINCKTLIVRHPSVVTSHLFAKCLHKIRSDAAYFVINNSQKRTSGEEVYSITHMLETIDQVSAETKRVCPISPVMRRELCESVPRDILSEKNWTPTFDLESYKVSPRTELRPPYRIGRHGRDGAEKWLEDPTLLCKAYPNDSDFRVRILGGAKNAARILGSLPENWLVHEFGSVPPKEYLETLDAFVYFPNTSLNEGFGRTIAEAMIAGIPCILPFKFEETFSDLAFYCEPEHVASLVRELGRHDAERIDYLKEVQKLVESQYSSNSISNRLPEWRFADRNENKDDNIALPIEKRNFRLTVMKNARGESK